MKKILAIILSLLFVICLTGCENTFDTNKPDEDGAGLYVTGTNTLKYSWSKMIRMGWINEDGTANDEHIDDISGKLVFPSTINAIPDNAFGYCQNIEEIVLPTSIYAIGEYAFQGCFGLTNITIPCDIEKDAFFYCENLKNVTILEGATRIEEYAFYHCESLETLKIPKSIEKIGKAVIGETYNVKIIYNGTRAEWRSINKYVADRICYEDIMKEWDRDAKRFSIECTDGVFNWANEDI